MEVEVGLAVNISLVVVVSSPHQSPRCCVWRVEKVWKFWLPTVPVGDLAAKRQLPFAPYITSCDIWCEWNTVWSDFLSIFVVCHIVANYTTSCSICSIVETGDVLIR